ncbi:hypothetical protein [Microbulbifer magnicolonia]|uniref:bestrophin-like domain n=1 Tax=Microbulbifer magnicolonia TaxID=3109744 RepID=UPI002B418669|nr:hypothetical protein [Microbulbifer sp. GG15]
MDAPDSLFTLTLFQIYWLSILVVLGSLAIGHFLGRRSTRKGDVSDASLGSAVAATLGLLAFMLAFTFNLVAERYAQRKALVLEEANTIGTTYLRADLLEPRRRERARALLAEYAALRDINLRDLSDFPSRMQRTEVIQADLWALVAQLSAEGYDPVRLRDFYEPLNSVIDSHNSRVVIGMQYQIPTPIWVALYAITALAMFAIGFQLGSSRRGSPQVAVALALAFSLVILLIADLDRSFEGFLLVDQRPMAELHERLLRERSQVPPD